MPPRKRKVKTDPQGRPLQGMSAFLKRYHPPADSSKPVEYPEVWRGGRLLRGKARIRARRAAKQEARS